MKKSLLVWALVLFVGAVAWSQFPLPVPPPPPAMQQAQFMVTVSWYQAPNADTYTVYKASYPFTSPSDTNVQFACATSSPVTSCTSSAMGPGTFWGVTASNLNGTSPLGPLMQGP